MKDVVLCTNVDQTSMYSSPRYYKVYTPNQTLGLDTVKRPKFDILFGENIFFLQNLFGWPPLKGTQDWDFFWLRFWNLYYFFVSHVKILRFYKKKFWIGPFWGEVRFFRVVLGLRRMKKNVELGQKLFYFFFHLWTLFMSQY